MKVEAKKIDSGSEAFVGQNEAKSASFENFKFAVEHDPKEEYIAKNTEFVQHDSVMDTLAHKKEKEAQKQAEAKKAAE